MSDEDLLMKRPSTTGNDGDEAKRAESTLQTGTHTAENSGAADDLEKLQGQMMEAMDGMQMNLENEVSDSADITATAPVAAQETAAAAAEPQPVKALDSQPTAISLAKSDDDMPGLASNSSDRESSVIVVYNAIAHHYGQRISKSESAEFRKLVKDVCSNVYGKALTNIELQQIVEKANNPEDKKRVTKIQASFRGQRGRKAAQKRKAAMMESNTSASSGRKSISRKRSLKKIQDAENEKLVQEIAASPDSQDKVVKIQSGFRAKRARKDVAKKRKQNAENEKLVQEIAASPDSQDKVVKIQSGFRAKRARKEVAKKKQDTENDKLVKEIAASPDSKDKVIKIQSGFRGKKARKEVAKKKQDSENDKLVKEIAACPDSQDKIVKIQSGFRGKKARKEVAAVKAVKDAEEEPARQEEKKAKAAVQAAVATPAKVTSASAKGAQARQFNAADDSSDESECFGEFSPRAGKTKAPPPPFVTKAQQLADKAKKTTPIEPVHFFLIFSMTLIIILILSNNTKSHVTFKN